MEDEDKIINNWADLFSEICYAFELQYCHDLKIENMTDGTQVLNVYKLTLHSNGFIEYKGHITRFNTSLWPRVVLFAKLFEHNGVIDILYAPK